MTLKEIIIRYLLLSFLTLLTFGLMSVVLLEYYIKNTEIPHNFMIVYKIILGYHIGFFTPIFSSLFIDFFYKRLKFETVDVQKIFLYFYLFLLVSFGIWTGFVFDEISISILGGCIFCGITYVRSVYKMYKELVTYRPVV
jgi:hypothetical protein